MTDKQATARDAGTPIPMTAELRDLVLRMQVVHEIQAERDRQVDVEGWTTDHDDEHAGGVLAQAAACYAIRGEAPCDDVTQRVLNTLWPFEAEWWKPRDHYYNLIRAGALIVAEAETLLRKQMSQGKTIMVPGPVGGDDNSGNISNYRGEPFIPIADEAERPWVDEFQWERCDGAVDLDYLEGADCWAGLDTLDLNGLCAWRLVWFKDDHWFTWGRRWVPAAVAMVTTATGAAPMTGWARSGLIELFEGDRVDCDAMRSQILHDLVRFRPKICAYDRWSAGTFTRALQRAGVEMVPFTQGPREYHPAMKALDEAYRAQALSHDDDEVLRWCMLNLVVRRDPNGNMAPDRVRSPESIADATALLMAFGVAQGDIVTVDEGVEAGSDPVGGDLSPPKAGPAS